MNFNYSYRAFLITSLLVGNLVLLLLTINLSGTEETPEIVTAVEYALDLPEEVKDEVSEKVKVNTNTAYNEAEKFISELEDSRNSSELISEENTSTESSSTSNDLALNDAREKLSAVKVKLSEKAKKELATKKNEGVNSKTTISYRLIDRKALWLRNPVYTCDKGGKIVISIEVNELGKVVKATYNKNASTTTNGCLIESALTYANRSKFSTSAAVEKQLGTISYHFPGQD